MKCSVIKSKNVLALTAALSVLCSQSVFAATLELDLEETIQRALLTNPSVKLQNRSARKPRLITVRLKVRAASVLV